MIFKELKRDINPHQIYRIKKLKSLLEKAENYEQWKDLAYQLDDLTGAHEWKLDNSSEYFDAELLSHRYNLLKRCRLEGRDKELLQVIREGLSHDVANIGHPMLFNMTYIGTKKLIEEYVHEMSQNLAYIASDECQSFSREEKIKIFENCEKAYGRPVLMFSGGATLGLFHGGVCKALLEQDLLPTVMSGSSAGAIMAGMVGTTTKKQIQEILGGAQFFSEAFKFRKISEIFRGSGGIADVMHLKKFLMENLGDVTFAEAYEISGRHINIVVAPYDASQPPRIMNALTAPDLLVWSAVLASCAVPVLFPPVRLTSKRFDGVHTPYMAKTRWVDGSVRSDLPQEKIARLYNVNYSIACQVNPHIVPFMQSDEERYRKDLLSWPERIIRQQGKVIALGVMDFTRERMGLLPPFQRLLDHGYGIIDQRYYGDVNIIGKYNLRHYRYMFKNPNLYLFKLLQKEGERATWPKLTAIETHARIGKTILHSLDKLRGHVIL